jgi:hypothetical protein
MAVTDVGIAKTREQLNELDSLIERMLTLPLSHLPEAEARTPTQDRLPPEAFLPYPDDRAYTPPRVYPQDAQHVEATQSTVQGWRIEFPAGPRFIQGIPGEVPTPGVNLPHLPSEALPEAPFAEAVPPTALTAPQEFSLNPLAIFDACCRVLFGWVPIVGWFTRPAGKTVCGILGALMLLAAIGWAYFDFTELRWLRLDASTQNGLGK